MKLNIRPALPQDVSGVVELIQAYTGEVFLHSAAVTAEALLRDGFGSVLEFLLAENERGDLVGFAAWEKTYDIVSGTRGGALLGFYLAPSQRNQGGGEILLSGVATEVRAMGGTFLTGLGLGRADLGGPSTSALSLTGPGPEVERLRVAADLSLSVLTKLGVSLRSLLPPV